MPGSQQTGEPQRHQEEIAPPSRWPVSHSAHTGFGEGTAAHSTGENPAPPSNPFYPALPECSLIISSPIPQAFLSPQISPFCLSFQVPSDTPAPISPNILLPQRSLKCTQDGPPLLYPTQNPHLSQSPSHLFPLKFSCYPILCLPTASSP